MEEKGSEGSRVGGRRGKEDCSTGKEKMERLARSIHSLSKPSSKPRESKDSIKNTPAKTDSKTPMITERSLNPKSSQSCRVIMPSNERLSVKSRRSPPKEEPEHDFSHLNLTTESPILYSSKKPLLNSSHLDLVANKLDSKHYNKASLYSPPTPKQRVPRKPSSDSNQAKKTFGLSYQTAAAHATSTKKLPIPPHYSSSTASSSNRKKDTVQTTSFANQMSRERTSVNSAMSINSPQVGPSGQLSSREKKSVENKDRGMKSTPGSGSFLGAANHSNREILASREKERPKTFHEALGHKMSLTNASSIQDRKSSLWHDSSFSKMKTDKLENSTIVVQDSSFSSNIQKSESSHDLGSRFAKKVRHAIVDSKEKRNLSSNVGHQSLEFTTGSHIPTLDNSPLVPVPSTGGRAANLSSNKKPNIKIREQVPTASPAKLDQINQERPGLLFERKTFDTPSSKDSQQKSKMLEIATKDFDPLACLDQILNRTKSESYFSTSKQKPRAHNVDLITGKTQLRSIASKEIPRVFPDRIGKSSTLEASIPALTIEEEGEDTEFCDSTRALKPEDILVPLSKDVSDKVDIEPPIESHDTSIINKVQLQESREGEDGDNYCINSQNDSTIKSALDTQTDMLNKIWQDLGITQEESPSHSISKIEHSNELISSELPATESKLDLLESWDKVEEPTSLDENTIYFLPPGKSSIDKTLIISLDNILLQTVNSKIKSRDGSLQFIESLATAFEVVVWSSLSPLQTIQLVRSLDPLYEYIVGVLDARHLNLQGMMDLRVFVNRDPSKIYLLTTKRQIFADQATSVIPVEASPVLTALASSLLESYY
jgi:hypothetical protein